VTVDREVRTRDAAWPQRLLGLPRRLTVTAVTALVALVAATVGLVFNLWPGLKPDPEVQLHATIKPVGLEPNVLYTNFLERMGRNSAHAANVSGNVVYVQLETEGLKGYESHLRWYLYKLPTGRRLKRERQPNDNVQLVSGTTSDRYVIPVWVQAPRDTGTYFVRFELEARGVLLAIANSHSFPNCTVQCTAPST
jgi:hypothetical protein